MINNTTFALFAILYVAAMGHIAVPGVAAPPPTAAGDQPWKDIGPPSPPELLEMVIPGSEWREENGRCILRVDTCVTNDRINDLKGTITYPDGRTKPWEGSVVASRLVLFAPYEFALEGRIGSAMAPMRVVDGKVVIHVDWHEDHKDPNRKPVRLISPLKPPPRRPMPNDT